MRRDELPIDQRDFTRGVSIAKPFSSLILISEWGLYGFHANIKILDIKWAKD